MSRIADVGEDVRNTEIELNKDLCSPNEHATSVVAIAEKTALAPGLKNPSAVRIRSLSNLETIKAIVADTTGCCW